MHRKDFYFRELVTEAELDAAFQGSEDADRNFALDNDFKQKADVSNVPFSTPDTGDFNALLGGIVKGLNITISGLGATVSAGTAYDCQGRRICLTSPLTVDLSTTGDTGIGEGGAASGIGSISTAPSSGQFRWILLQIFFNRLLTDPREDGNLATVYFDSAESFQFKVKCSASSATPTKPGGDPNCVILGLFKRNDAGAIATQDYSTRGDWIRTFSTYSTDPLPTAQAENGTTTDVNFIQGTARGSLIKLRNAINLSNANYAGHIDQSNPQDKHAAKNIDFSATTANWADGTSPALASNLGGGLATNGLQGVINTLVTLLADTTGGAGGTKKIGGASITGSPVSIAGGTLRSQLDGLLSGLNGHINNVGFTHAATTISAIGGLNRAGTNVQAQLDELDALSEARRPGVIFGYGEDGNATLSTPLMITANMNYANLTINTNGILLTNGYVVRVQGTLTINGSGYISATNSTLSTLSNRWGQDTATALGGVGDIKNDYGILLGGQSGGNGAFGITGPAAGTDAYFSLGGSGGVGGMTGGAGGTTFQTISPSNIGAINDPAGKRQMMFSYLNPGYLQTISGTTGSVKTIALVGIQGGAGGGGGGFGATTGGGGGGAGGGVCIVIARNVVLATDHSIRAPGFPGGPGNFGGLGSDGGGGGGGGGGVVILWYADKSGPVLTNAAACPGGPAGPNGGAGSAALNGGIGNAYEFRVTMA